MNIFIRTINIIKCIVNNKNDNLLFYDYISDDDLSFLNKHFDLINYKTIYGHINKKNFVFSIIKDDNNDFNDIKLLLNNKLYNQPLHINDIINNIKTQLNNHTVDFQSNFNNNILTEQDNDILRELTITTEQLKNNMPNNDNIILTEFINDDDYDVDDDNNNEFMPLLKNIKLSYSINSNNIDTEKNI